MRTPPRLKALLQASALLLAACATVPPDEDFEFAEEAPLRPVAHVDLDRYMGRWYLMANIPYFAESGNVAPYVEYRRRTDGLIDDHYTARPGFDQPPFTKQGLIEVTDRLHNAEGRITFLGPLWQDYAVVYLDPDYRYTAIAHPSRDYAWLFAREPHIPDDVYQEMLAALAANAFDVRRVLRIPHRPEQAGLPGYQ